VDLEAGTDDYGADQVIYSLAAAAEARDPYTEAHAQRVGQSARRIGARMGLSPGQ